MPPARTVRAWTWAIVAVVAAVAVAVLPGWWRTLTLGPADIAGQPAGWPQPPGDEHSSRILPAVSTPSGRGGYVFLRTKPDGTPVSYDPCRPIHYVINPGGAPTGGMRLVTAAVARVSSATGLQFHYDGTTTEPFARQRPDVIPDRYGDRWAPVLVEWKTADQDPELAGYVAGLGGSDAVGRTEADAHYVTGTLVLDRSAFSVILSQPGGRAEAEAIVLHELGHVVGLDHVNDPRQIMYSESQWNVTTYGAGDLRGLAVLGQGACYPRD